MASVWLWPEDEQRVQQLRLGPFSPTEVILAASLARPHFLQLPAWLRREILSWAGPGLKATVYFMCAEQVDANLRRFAFRCGLQELGYFVSYQL